jgi:hypothetical protein
MVTNQAFNLSKATGALRNALIALTATSTPVKSTERTISGGSGDVMVDGNILNASEGVVANTLTTIGIKRFTVYLYNSNNDFLGYAEFAFEVVKPDPAIIADGTTTINTDYAFFTSGDGMTATSAKFLSAGYTRYITGYTSDNPFIVAPASTLVAGAGDHTIKEVVNSIARNLVAETPSATEHPFNLKVAKVVKVVGTTKTEEPNLEIDMVNEKFEITYTATDLAGNSKTIFVTLNKYVP